VWWLDLLLPASCASCTRIGALLCPACRRGLKPSFDPRDRFLAPDPGTLVGDRLQLAVAPFAHTGSIRRALAALKYMGASRMAPILAEEAASSLATMLSISGPATLAPVPVHAERLRARGYNQAALLAAALGRLQRAPLTDLLVRTRATTKQHRLNRGARLQNLRGAFAVTRHPPSTVILVDDIVTTTATLEACASVLRDAGCEAVFGFAIARET
jgi:ComF family protein